MALQIRRGTSTNPTLEEGELYLNTDTGVIYTKIGSTVVPISASSANRAKKIYLSLKNAGTSPYDDWTGSSVVYCDDEVIAGADITVSFLGGGVMNVAFDPALDPDATYALSHPNPVGMLKTGGSEILYYDYQFSAIGGIVINFYNASFVAVDMEAVNWDLLLVLDYLEALPT